TTACSRRPPASAPLRLPGAAEAQRSVLRRLGLGLRHLGGEGETRQPGGPRVDRGGHVAAAQGGGGRARGAWSTQASGGGASGAPGLGRGWSLRVGGPRGAGADRTTACT